MKKIQWSPPIFGWQYELHWYKEPGGWRATNFYYTDLLSIRGTFHEDYPISWHVMVRSGPTWVSKVGGSLLEAIQAVEQTVAYTENCFRQLRGKMS